MPIILCLRMVMGVFRYWRQRAIHLVSEAGLLFPLSPCLCVAKAIIYKVSL